MAELEMKPSHFGLRGFSPNYVAIELLKQFTLPGNVDAAPAGSFAIPCGCGVPQLLPDSGSRFGPPDNSSPHKSSGLGCGPGPGRPGQSSLLLLVD